MYRNTVIVSLLLACLGLPAVAAPPAEPAVVSGDAADQAENVAPVASAELTCAPVTLEEGPTGTYTASDGDDHMKHHFIMPASVVELRVKVGWPDPTWKIRVDLGEGNCPHSGTTHQQAEGVGEVSFHLASASLEPALEEFATGARWFVHLAASNPQASGNTVEYALDVQACSAAGGQ